MSSIPTLPGITSRMVPTARINTHVLFSGPDDGEPVAGEAAGSVTQQGALCKFLLAARR